MDPYSRLERDATLPPQSDLEVFREQPAEKLIFFIFLSQQDAEIRNASRVCYSTHPKKRRNTHKKEEQKSNAEAAGTYVLNADGELIVWAHELLKQLPPA